MPRKKQGHTFVLIEFPDELLEAARTKAGELSLTAFVCKVVAKSIGVTYKVAPRGAPTGPRKPKKQSVQAPAPTGKRKAK